jgi:hypothetical protein
MRRARRALTFVVVSFWLAGTPAACTSSGPGGPVEGGVATDGGSPDSAGEAGSDQENVDVPPPARFTHVRFAAWWPDLPEADFCVAPLTRNAGDAAKADSGVIPWQGPIVAQAASAVDGGVVNFPDAAMPGVSFPQVTTYFDLPPGAYQVRTVSAGASDCAMNVLPDQPFPAFPADAFTTVAVVGYIAGDALVTIEALRDDTSASRPKAGLRFVAALTSGASLSVGRGVLGSPGFEPLFVDVPFGQAGVQAETDAGKVDKNGYLSIQPLADTTLTVTVTGGFDAGAIDAGIDAAGIDASRFDAGGFDASGPFVSQGVSTAAGSVATLAAVGTITDPLVPPRLLLCLDTAPAIGVLFTDCKVLASPGD